MSRLREQVLSRFVRLGLKNGLHNYKYKFIRDQRDRERERERELFYITDKNRF